MQLKKKIGLLAMSLLLSSCTDLIFPSSEPGSEDPSNSITSEPEENELLQGNLSTFATDIINDPAIPYTNEDYIVRPFNNGFTYPADAQVQPTNAYLEFWHSMTDLNFRIVADKQVFKWIEQYGVHEQNKADLYFPVSLEVTMNTKKFIYYEVGMRVKGNTSRTDFLKDDGTFHKSLSFKLSFNELWDEPEYEEFGLRKTWTKADNPEWKTRDDRTFMGDGSGKYGMKKIDIKWNKSEDRSLVIQPYVFSFFQKHGVISQNSTLSTLNINGQRHGVVTLNETIDKHLLRRYFPKVAAAGELYKVGWGKTANDESSVMGSLRYEDLRFQNESAQTLKVDAVIGEEDKTIGYNPAYDAKEFDDEASAPFAKLINVMKVLKDNEGKTPAQAKPNLEALIDMDSFLKYAALSYFGGNIDDMRNWGNNYYVFFNPSNDNKAYFIPYDYDWALGLTWNGYDHKAMFGTDPLSNRHQSDTNVFQSNRLYWYTIISSNNQNRPYKNITMNSEYQNTYKDYLRALNNDAFYSETSYEALYQMYRTTYNTKSGNDVNSNTNFTSAAFMKEFIGSTKTKINSIS